MAHLTPRPSPGTSLTAAQADLLLDELELAVRKVRDASQASRVRLQRAEIELLAQIQRVRDFTEAAGRRKDLLHEIFAGDCPRTVRIRAALGSVSFSPMQSDEGDQRVASCLRACETVDGVLQDQGTGHNLHAAPSIDIGTHMVKPSDAAAVLSKTLDQESLTSPRRPRSFRPGEDPVPGILAEEDPVRLLALEPSRSGYVTPWMIWMVHRAHLNDPTLKVFDFTHLQMPAGDAEPRIAPKLASAMASNAHIEELSLANANLQGPEARLLAASLESNAALRVLNVDSNCLAPWDLMTLVQGVGKNRSLQEFRCNNQHKGDAGRAGSEVLEELLEAVRANTRITRLGMYITDPHYNNEISNQLTRNKDRLRLARRGNSGDSEESVLLESRSPVSPKLPELPEEMRSAKPDEALPPLPGQVTQVRGDFRQAPAAAWARVHARFEEAPKAAAPELSSPCKSGAPASPGTLLAGPGTPQQRQISAGRPSQPLDRNTWSSSPRKGRFRVTPTSTPQSIEKMPAEVPDFIRAAFPGAKLAITGPMAAAAASPARSLLCSEASSVYNISPDVYRRLAAGGKMSAQEISSLTTSEAFPAL